MNQKPMFEMPIDLMMIEHYSFINFYEWISINLVEKNIIMDNGIFVLKWMQRIEFMVLQKKEGIDEQWQN